MDDKTLNHILKNYNDLLARVETHILGVTKAYKDQIACKKGCDDCCRSLTLFPVEALALSRAFAMLKDSDKEKVLNEVNTHPDKCPLLINHSCMLYHARPVICRTHGFPLYMEKDGEAMVDFCPENFKSMTRLPKTSMLNLDQLNTLLTAINQHFVENFSNIPKRIPVSQAFFLCETLNRD